MTNTLQMTRRTMLTGAAVAGALTPIIVSSTVQANEEVAAADALKTAKQTKVDLAKLPREKIALVKPPFVHTHQQKADGGPKIKEFTLTIQEKKMILDKDGTEINAMTFDGSVPGPLMVVHQDDYVELTLVNPETNTLQHNIDFHAATGALGGGALTVVNPGESTVFRFKATKAGVFVYHCAPPGMVPWHVTSGMNGAIMVLPREGLKDGKGKPLVYDKIYYVGEQDFYVPRDASGKFKKYDSPGEAYDETVAVMKTLTPTHIVFNGAVGALTGENAMTAKVGETVLIVHSQANRDTRPHLIGGHGEYVWATGKFLNPPDTDQETWFIPGGTAGAALYTFAQPGIYAYVNHNLIEAFELGAAAHFKVTGEWDDDLMTSVRAPSAS
ncbi:MULTISPECIES: copper-containing nitrite reductase [Rhizobium]|uniref:copper-containing nitrite reductase n=1 Tax=Rhizobium TaxID=379 RepID=UPI001B31D291|nr:MULTISPECIES: copper-containing nitrite reductase [Rhizobium]MBX4911897.1 nitrite reductase, copper-containing [Rhizobium bangladeshense]MBX5260840.1 nitrite reductase, copper-containing [Rhizobium sp. NLR16b]MBX5266929.1 nitrite reductase, copper-containing [Rhizobium sp. NLR16a]MBX5315497.1 nitrite reductase, copper-containing [Rhizobium sp. NLR11b]QTV00497.1 nitrite reductase, copper-containing [Rhizobium sp. NLR16a]